MKYVFFDSRLTIHGFFCHPERSEAVSASRRTFRALCPPAEIWAGFAFHGFSTLTSHV
jgi:hypothetical protein